MTTQHTPGRLYIRTNRHPNTDGTPWGWVDLYEPGSMLQASPEGMQVTWSRGQKSEANARRLVACWNACDGITTERLEEIDKPLLMHLTGADRRAARMVQERRELLEALRPIAERGEISAKIITAARAAIAKVEAGK